MRKFPAAEPKGRRRSAPIMPPRKGLLHCDGPKSRQLQRHIQRQCVRPGGIPPTLDATHKVYDTDRGDACQYILRKNCKNTEILEKFRFFLHKGRGLGKNPRNFVALSGFCFGDERQGRGARKKQFPAGKKPGGELPQKNYFFEGLPGAAHPQRFAPAGARRPGAQASSGVTSTAP